MKRHRTRNEELTSPGGCTTRPEVSALSLHAIRVELSRRNLSVAGSRHQLEGRLKHHLSELSSHSVHFRHLPSFVTVPSAFTQSVSHCKHIDDDSSKSGLSTGLTAVLHSDGSNTAPVVEDLQHEPPPLKKLKEQPTGTDESPNTEHDPNRTATVQQQHTPSSETPPQTDTQGSLEAVAEADADAKAGEDAGADAMTGAEAGAEADTNTDVHDDDDDDDDALQNNKARIKGWLQARSVWVCGDDNMRKFLEISGPIGKGNLSRSHPCYSAPHSDGKKGRAMRQFLELNGAKAGVAKSRDGEAKEEVNGESGGNGAVGHDRRLSKGESEVQALKNVEHLQLSLVEAFYAAFVLRTLTMVCKDEEASKLLQCPKQTWALFVRRLGPTFAPKFVAYARYRAAGWLPRSGLKYGVDWVLYPHKPSPSDKPYVAPSQKRHIHSPYCIMLKFRDRNISAAATAAPAQCGQLDRTWASLQNRLRLVKNVSKIFIIVDVVFDSRVCVNDMRDAFRDVKLTEVTVDRWVP